MRPLSAHNNLKICIFQYDQTPARLPHWSIKTNQSRLHTASIHSINLWHIKLQSIWSDHTKTSHTLAPRSPPEAINYIKWSQKQFDALLSQKNHPENLLAKPEKGIKKQKLIYINCDPFPPIKNRKKSTFKGEPTKQPFAINSLNC